MLERVVMAGFGGQGLMFIGKLLAQAGMEEGLNVTYLPSYGAEVRGGTAHCHVVLSSEEISSPAVLTADSLLIMNQPSYVKFRPRLAQEGLLLTNSSMVETEALAAAVAVPVSKIATDMGDVRVANLAMLGAYHKAKPLFSEERLMSCLETALAGKREDMIEINKKAFQTGIEAVTIT